MLDEGVVWFRRFRKSLREHPAWWFSGFCGISVLAYVLTIVFGLVFWEEQITAWPVGVSEVRDLAFIAAGILAFWLTLWRSWISEKDSATSLRNLLHDRFQTGVTMIGNADALAVRIGGIHMIERLLQEYPDIYYTQAMLTLCGFIRHPTGLDSEVHHSTTRSDVQVAIRIVGLNRRLDFEESEADHPSFRGAGLSMADLRSLDLTHCDFSGSNLHLANFAGARICSAKFMREDGSYPATELTRAQLMEAVDWEECAPEFWERPQQREQ